MRIKMTKGFFAILIATLALAISLSGCGSGTPQEDEPSAVETPATEEPAASEDALSGSIMIAAAASLENAFAGDLIPRFNELHPGVEVTGTYDSSGKLQEQIEGGLGAAIFFSAATKQMDALVDGGYIDRANVVNLLENELVLITSVNSATTVTSFEDITNAASIAIGDPASVPAGQYAQEALTSLGLWDQVIAGASLGTNVTEVLNWVAEGSAEVGIVYATDAASMPDKIKTLAVAPADSLTTPVIYPVATLNSVSDENKASAGAFVEFLQSDEAMRVFEQYGFKPAPAD